MQMKWYVVHTQHHHEQAVSERFRLRGYEVYLPLATISHQSKHGLRHITAPLLPRHVLVRCHLDMYSHLELITTPGVTQLPEDAKGQLLAISEAEMRLLQQLCTAGLPLDRTASLPDGKWVRVVGGPLHGVLGVLDQGLPATLVVPIPTFRMSVGVSLGREQVVPYEVAQGIRLSNRSAQM
jgi:transcription antitermination factor NusG